MTYRILDTTQFSPAPCPFPDPIYGKIKGHPIAGSGPNATQLNSTLYNPIPAPKVKTRARTEMAITRLATTAVSQRLSGSKFHLSFAAPHLELTYVTQPDKRRYLLKMSGKG